MAEAVVSFLLLSLSLAALVGTALAVLRIEWDSMEGHLQGFRRSEEFRVFLGPVRPYVERIEEMQHYHVIPLSEGASKEGVTVR